MKENEVQKYPFRAGENKEIVGENIRHNMLELLLNPVYENHNRLELFINFNSHFERIEELFLYEEALRNTKHDGANLYYHNKDHALYQTTYDAITITQTLLERKDKLSSHLTAEGVYAIVLAAMYHDIGYVNEPKSLNFAGRNTIHVRESMFNFRHALKKVDIPDSLNFEKVQIFGLLGIHSTEFPYTKEREKEAQIIMEGMGSKEKKEAQIVRLTVKLADLGGQTARPDYPVLLKDLRAELNEASDNLGTQIIGSDEQMEQKRKEFIVNTVLPSVGKIASAFFRTESNPYFNSWKVNFS